MTLAYVAAWVIAISAFLVLPPIIWFTLRDAARDYREKKETDALWKGKP